VVRHRPHRRFPDEWTRADLEEHVRDEHSTFTWLLEPLLDRAGFTIADATYSDNQIFAQYLLRATGATVTS
jgi:hypothetical protein